MDQALTRSSRFLALGGVAAVVFEVVVLVWPNISLVALIALFGAFALLFGVLSLAGGLNLLAHRRTDWVPYILGGLAGIAIGAVTFFRPGITALALVYLIAGWAGYQSTEENGEHAGDAEPPASWHLSLLSRRCAGSAFSLPSPSWPRPVTSAAFPTPAS
jgi:hypothetical protein